MRKLVRQAIGGRSGSRRNGRWQAAAHGGGNMLPEDNGDDEWAGLVQRREQLKGIRGRPIGGEPENEADHFYTCAYCGQAVDRRKLFQVLHHEQAEHEPLPDDD
jgi:hypothetical protein